MKTDNHSVTVPIADYNEMLTALQSQDRNMINTGVDLLIGFLVSRLMNPSTIVPLVTPHNRKETFYQETIADFRRYATDMGYKVEFTVVANKVYFKDITKI